MKTYPRYRYEIKGKPDGQPATARPRPSTVERERRQRPRQREGVDVREGGGRLEDQVRPAPVTPHAAEPGRGWIVSPAFDLLFLANLGWLLLLLPGFATPDRHGHRLLADLLPDPPAPLDHPRPGRRRPRPPRRAGRARSSLVAALAAVVVAGRTSAPGRSCAWRWSTTCGTPGTSPASTPACCGCTPARSAAGREWLERWGCAGSSPTPRSAPPGGRPGGSRPTPTCAAVAARARPRSCWSFPRRCSSRTWSGSTRDRGREAGVPRQRVPALHRVPPEPAVRVGGRVVVFAAAGSMFHAVEYLAMVTHYARRRETVGAPARSACWRGTGCCSSALYVVVLGAVGRVDGAPGHGLVVLWQGLNLWAAFVHYAYDGMIWKLRRPETAARTGGDALVNRSGVQSCCRVRAGSRRAGGGAALHRGSRSPRPRD